MTPSYRLSLTDLRRAYAAGTLTPGEVVQTCLERAEALNPELRAFVSIDRPGATRAANQTDAPLAGVPLAHKDIFARPGRQPGCGVTTGDLPGSNLPPSPLLRRMEQAGAIDLGPLSMAEFALGTTGGNSRLGDAKNPWNTEYCTGASSSGSAVAVAAGMAFGSIGTDSGASIRTPAALCGIVGYMPEHGALSSEGCYPLSWSVDRPGILARTVDDAALLTDIARGRTPRPVEGPTGPLKVGFATSYYTDNLTPEVAAVLEAARSWVERQGHRIVEVPIVETVETRSLHRAIMRTEAAALHRDLMSTHPEFYDLSVRKFITGGEGIFAVDYVDALRLRGPLLQQARATTYAQCDVLLTPTTPTAALRYADISDPSQAAVWQKVTGLAHFTQPASYLGLPAISVPFDLSPDGLPIGVQLIAPPEREPVLLGLARQIETHWRGQDLWPAHAQQRPPSFDRRPP